MTLARIHLIIGGSGFIGSVLADALLGAGEEVVVVDDDTSLRFDQQFEDFKKYSHYISIRSSVLFPNTQMWIRNMSENRPVVIWHLAANSDIQSGSLNPDIDAEKTLMTSIAVCNLIDELDVISVNFASTSAVYGELSEGEKEFREESLCNPISYYGASKFAGEKFLEIACKRKKTPLAILRFANIVGTPATHGVIFDFIKKLLINPNQLEVLGNGTQVKTYLHVKSLIEMMMKVEDSKTGGVYNLSPGDGGIEVREIAELVASHFGTSPKITFEIQSQGWTGDVVKVLMSNYKYHQKYGDHIYSSKDSIHTAVHEIFNQLGVPYVCSDFYGKSSYENK